MDSLSLSLSQDSLSGSRPARVRRGKGPTLKPDRRRVPGWPKRVIWRGASREIVKAFLLFQAPRQPLASNLETLLLDIECTLCEKEDRLGHYWAAHVTAEGPARQGT